MFNRRKAVGPLLLGLLFVGSVTGQQYAFQYYGAEQGLTRLGVREIFQDREGYLWLSTEGGVFRFDGTRFRPFGAVDGLPFNVLASFGVASDGTLLLATESGLYRLVRQRFERLPLPGDPKVSPYGGVVTDPVGDTYVGAANGLWVSSSVTAGNSPQWRQIAVSPGDGRSSIRGLSSKGGDIWFVRGAKVFRLAGGRVQAYDAHDSTPDITRRWTGVVVDGQGVQWTVSFGSKVHTRPPSSAIFKPLAAGLPPASGYPIRIDSSGRALIPTTGGLAIAEGGRLRIVGRDSGLAGAVNCVFQDREGSLWIGLAGRGLAKWQGYGRWEGFGALNGLDPDVVYAVQPLRPDWVLAGTESGLFSGRREAERWRWTPDPRFKDMRIRAIRRAADGAIWVAAEHAGVARLDPSFRDIRWFPHAVSGAIYWDLRCGRAGRMWVGANSGALVIEPGADRMKPVEGSPRERVWQVADTDAGLWIASANGLTLLADGKARTFGPADGLPDAHLISIAAAPNGDVWAGYRSSGIVSQLRLENGRLRVLNHGPGRRAAAAITYFLEFDSKGRMWTGSDAGVDVYQSGAWTRYTHDDGLIWDDCNLHAFSEGVDDDVWIGSSGGLSRFHPTASPPPSIGGPRAVFSEVLLGDKSVTPSPTPGLAVGPNENSLSVTYSALSFVRERSILFRYRLEPASSQWRETTERKLQFPGLPPGRYRLEIVARDGWGNWGPRPAQLEFEIRPPWWLTWWATAIGAILVGCAVAALVAWRVHAYHRRIEAQRRERERESIVAAARAQLESFSHMNRVTVISEMASALAHEICQPLAAISSNASSAVILLDRPTPDIGEARQAVADIVDDQLRAAKIIDRMRAGLRRTKIQPAPQDINAIAEDAARFASQFAILKGMAIRMELAGGLAPVWTDEIQMQQVVWNLIQNAADAMAQVPKDQRVITVRTRLDASASSVLLEVEDNGPGVADQDKKRIFEPHVTTKPDGLGMGLAIIRSFLTLSGGGIEVCDAAGGGALFRVRIPLAETVGAGASK